MLVFITDDPSWLAWIARRRGQPQSDSARPAGHLVTGEAETPIPEGWTPPGWGSHTG